MKLYLDTSVLVAYYYPEALSSQVQSLLNTAEKPGLSFLTEVELCSAVAKKIRSKEIDSPDGSRILAKFFSHVDMELFTIIPVANHHWRLARSWISLFSTPLRTLDAIHLAIASDADLEMITADKLLYQAAGVLDVKAQLMTVDG